MRNSFLIFSTFIIIALIAVSSSHVCATTNAPAEISNNYKIHNITPPMSTSNYSKSYVEDNEGHVKHKIKTGWLSSRSYHVYNPTDNLDKPRPAILLLHGSGRSGTSLVDKWGDIANEHDVVLIGPDGIGNLWRLEKDGDGFIEAVINDAVEKYNIDRNRIYLFGHSLGAIFALYLTLEHSDIFAATSLHAGKFDHGYNYEMVDDVKNKTPIALFVGTNDSKFPVYEVKNTAKKFHDNGHKVELYLLKRHNHWYYDLAPFINEKAWGFMSQYTLD